MMRILFRPPAMIVGLLLLTISVVGNFLLRYYNGRLIPIYLIPIQNAISIKQARDLHYPEKNLFSINSARDYYYTNSFTARVKRGPFFLT